MKTEMEDMFPTVQCIRKTMGYSHYRPNLGENYTETPTLPNRKKKVNLLNPDNVIQQKSLYPDT
jgi:hypothetical protein